MPVRTYNIADVIATVDGVVVEGGADGDKIVVTRNADNFSLQPGTDGEMVRSAQNNKSGRITITLLYGAPIIDFLVELAERDEETGSGVVPVSVTDLRGSSLMSADAAWIVKVGDVTYGRDAGSVEFIFECAQLNLSPGSLQLNGGAG